MSWCNPPEANECDDDYLDWSDDDNNVCTSSKYVVSSSSDDDAEQFLERIKSRKFVKKPKVSDGKDDFEREMASELSRTMQQLTASICKQSSNTTSAAPENTSESKEAEGSKEFYDEIYFDSDDSDTEELSHKASGTTSRKGNRRRILSNDELFYDPKMDDHDQAWMDKMRRSYQVKNKKRPGNCKASKTSQSLPESDAVLNCPGCLTMLCMDCQRHEIYTNQYRAMFVFNCNIDWTELLKFPKKNQKKKEFFKNKKKFKKMQEEVKEIPSTQQKMDVEVKENLGDKTIQVSVGHASKAGELSSIAAESTSEGSNPVTAEGTTEGANPVAAESTTKKSNLVTAESTTEGSNPVAAESTTEKSNPVTAKSPTEGSNPVAAESTIEESKFVIANNSTKILVSGSELEVSVNTNKPAEGKCLGSNPEEELFHPVTCKICNTKVAVYDKEEVYHFFNIVTSY